MKPEHKPQSSLWITASDLMETKPRSELIPTSRHSEDSEQTSQVCRVPQPLTCEAAGLKQRTGCPHPAQQFLPVSFSSPESGKAFDFWRGRAGQGWDWPSLSWPQAAGGAASSPSSLPAFPVGSCGLLGPSPDGPLVLTGARCWAAAFTILGWWRVVVSKCIRPKEPF